MTLNTRLLDSSQIHQRLNDWGQLIRLATRSDASKELHEEQRGQKTKNIDDEPDNDLGVA